MGKEEHLLTTKEFAATCGWSVARVTQALRERRIRGRKISGRWMIAASEMPRAQEPQPTPPRRPETPRAATPEAPRGATRTPADFGVEEFSRLTYLTPQGVRQWLKAGRLPASRGPDGEVRVDAVCLSTPDIKRLLR
jgi:hypothetical protein